MAEPATTTPAHQRPLVRDLTTLARAAYRRKNSAVVRTFTGLMVDLLKIEPHQVCTEDIAVPLARLPRYGGHTRDFYSVAQHSVVVSYLVPPPFALEGLLHDASEAYVQDLVTPIKRLLPIYGLLEEHVQSAIAEKFGLVWPFPAAVKRADSVAFLTEYRDLMRGTTAREVRYLSEQLGVSPIDRPFGHIMAPMGELEARRAFLTRLLELSPRDPAAAA